MLRKDEAYISHEDGSLTARMLSPWFAVSSQRLKEEKELVAIVGDKSGDWNANGYAIAVNGADYIKVGNRKRNKLKDREAGLIEWAHNSCFGTWDGLETIGNLN